MEFTWESFSVCNSGCATMLSSSLRKREYTWGVLPRLQFQVSAPPMLSGSLRKGNTHGEFFPMGIPFSEFLFHSVTTEWKRMSRRPHAPTAE